MSPHLLGVALLCHPQFSQRVGACFTTVNVTAPNDAQLKRIFGTLLNAKLADFDDEVRGL